MPLIYSAGPPQPRERRAIASWLVRSAKLAVPAVLVAALSAVIFALAEPGGPGSPEAAPGTLRADQPGSGSASASSTTAVSVTVRMAHRRHRWVAKVHKSTNGSRTDDESTATTSSAAPRRSAARVRTVAAPRHVSAKRAPRRSSTTVTTAPATTVTVPAATSPRSNGRHLGNANGKSAPTPPPATSTTTTTTTTTTPTTRPGASGTAPGH
jgi:hypothetical protein